jgi:hypothetical protein
MFGTDFVVTAHTAAGRIRRPVSCVVESGSCRIIMLRREELAFLKAMSTLQLSSVALGTEDGNVSKEEASGACRCSRHHIWMWDQSTPTTIESAGVQTENQRGSKLGPLV